MKYLTIITLLTLTIAPAVFAGEEKHEEMPPPHTNPAFERVKALAGEWEGILSNTHNGESEETTVRYKVTSGGASVVETIFEGKPHEMVSVYYPEGELVKMTHYCMLGNRPELTLKDTDTNSLSFEMIGQAGISSADEWHMHAVTLTVDESGNSLTQEWQSYRDNKPEGEITKVVLTRKVDTSSL